MSFLHSSQQTLGFIATNPQDAVRAVAQFVAFERVTPHTIPSAEFLHKLSTSYEGVTYEFPRQLAVESALVATCGSVSIHNRGADRYAVQFGSGFSCPALNQAIGLPEIPLRQLDFELGRIPDSHGTWAFSEAGATEVLCDAIAGASCSINKSNTSELLLEHSGHQYSATISIFVFVCTSIQETRNNEGLLVIPANAFQLHAPLVSIVIAPTLTATDAPVASIPKGLETVEQLTTKAMNDLFGERSPIRLRSLPKKRG